MKIKQAVVAAAALAVLGTVSNASFAAAGKVDPYLDGAKIGAVDPYTDGARLGKPDPFTDGA